MDIKQQINKGTKLSANLVISEGNKYLRLLAFNRAISSFEKILKQDPNNVQCLLGRAKCYMKLTKYKEAWNDVDQVIKLNPKCTEAVYLKGMTEYIRGNFEKGFQTYWEGYKLRPNCGRLKQGYQVCRKAIENSLDVDTHMPQTEKQVRKMNDLLEDKQFPLEDDADNKAVYDSNKGLFSSDIKLLEDILKDENLTPIHSLSKELCDYLRERQKCFKMQDTCTTVDKSSSIFVDSICHIQQINQLVRNYGLCQLALKEGKTGICIKKGHKVLDIIDSVSSDFPEKKKMAANTLHYLVMAHLLEEDFSTALKYCNKQLSAARDSSVLGAKGTAFRDYGEVYCKTAKYDKALQFFRESFQLVQNSEEKAKILYKISNCQLHLKNLQDAEKSAQKCLEFIVKCHNMRFQLDTLLLLAEIAVKGKKMKDAEEYYKKAFEIAVQNNDARQKDLKYLLNIFREIG